VILYLDTSAFIKLYVQEAHSERIRPAVRAAAALCTHLITYAEMRAAFAKARRMGRLEEDGLRDLVTQLDQDWEQLDVIGVDEPLARRAGGHAERFGLRGYDSVHLAAAETIALAGSGLDYRVAALDRRLIEAAEALGMQCLGPH